MLPFTPRFLAGLMQGLQEEDPDPDVAAPIVNGAPDTSAPPQPNNQAPLPGQSPPPSGPAQAGASSRLAIEQIANMAIGQRRQQQQQQPAPAPAPAQPVVDGQVVPAMPQRAQLTPEQQQAQILNQLVSGQDQAMQALPSNPGAWVERNLRTNPVDAQTRSEVVTAPDGSSSVVRTADQGSRPNPGSVDRLSAQLWLQIDPQIQESMFPAISLFMRTVRGKPAETWSDADWQIYQNANREMGSLNEQLDHQQATQATTGSIAPGDDAYIEGDADILGTIDQVVSYPMEKVQNEAADVAYREIVLGEDTGLDNIIWGNAYKPDSQQGAEMRRWIAEQDPALLQRIYNDGWDKDGDGNDVVYGGAAIWDAYVDDKPWWEKSLIDVTTDPLNVLGGFGRGAAQGGARGVAASDDIIRSGAAPIQGRILKGLSKTVEVGGKVISAPERIEDGVIGGALRGTKGLVGAGVRQIPGAGKVLDGVGDAAEEGRRQANVFLRQEQILPDNRTAPDAGPLNPDAELKADRLRNPAARSQILRDEGTFLPETETLPLNRAQQIIAAAARKKATPSARVLAANMTGDAANARNRALGQIVDDQRRIEATTPEDEQAPVSALVTDPRLRMRRQAEIQAANEGRIVDIPEFTGQAEELPERPAIEPRSMDEAMTGAADLSGPQEPLALADSFTGARKQAVTPGGQPEEPASLQSLFAAQDPPSPVRSPNGKAPVTPQELQLQRLVKQQVADPDPHTGSAIPDATDIDPDEKVLSPDDPLVMEPRGDEKVLAPDDPLVTKQRAYADATFSREEAIAAEARATADTEAMLRRVDEETASRGTARRDVSHETSADVSDAHANAMRVELVRDWLAAHQGHTELPAGITEQSILRFMDEGFEDDEILRALTGRPARNLTRDAADAQGIGPATDRMRELMVRLRAEPPVQTSPVKVHAVVHDPVSVTSDGAVIPTARLTETQVITSVPEQVVAAVSGGIKPTTTRRAADVEAILSHLASTTNLDAIELRPIPQSQAGKVLRNFLKGISGALSEKIVDRLGSLAELEDVAVRALEIEDLIGTATWPARPGGGPAPLGWEKLMELNADVLDGELGFAIAKMRSARYLFDLTRTIISNPDDWGPVREALATIGSRIADYRRPDWAAMDRGVVGKATTGADSHIDIRKAYNAARALVVADLADHGLQPAQIAEILDELHEGIFDGIQRLADIHAGKASEARGVRTWARGIPTPDHKTLNDHLHWHQSPTRYAELIVPGANGQPIASFVGPSLANVRAQYLARFGDVVADRDTRLDGTVWAWDSIYGDAPTATKLMVQRYKDELQELRVERADLLRAKRKQETVIRGGTPVDLEAEIAEIDRRLDAWERDFERFQRGETGTGATRRRAEATIQLEADRKEIARLLKQTGPFDERQLRLRTEQLTFLEDRVTRNVALVEELKNSPPEWRFTNQLVDDVNAKGERIQRVRERAGDYDRGYPGGEQDELHSLWKEKHEYEARAMALYERHQRQKIAGLEYDIARLAAKPTLTGQEKSDLQKLRNQLKQAVRLTSVEWTGSVKNKRPGSLRFAKPVNGQHADGVLARGRIRRRRHLADVVWRHQLQPVPGLTPTETREWQEFIREQLIKRRDLVQKTWREMQDTLDPRKDAEELAKWRVFFEGYRDDEREVVGKIALYNDAIAGLKEELERPGAWEDVEPEWVQLLELADRTVRRARGDEGWEGRLLHALSTRAHNPTRLTALQQELLEEDERTFHLRKYREIILSQTGDETEELLDMYPAQEIEQLERFGLLPTAGEQMDHDMIRQLFPTDEDYKKYPELSAKRAFALEEKLRALKDERADLHAQRGSRVLEDGRVIDEYGEIWPDEATYLGADAKQDRVLSLDDTKNTAVLDDQAAAEFRIGSSEEMLHGLTRKDPEALHRIVVENVGDVFDGRFGTGQREGFIEDLQAAAGYYNYRILATHMDITDSDTVSTLAMDIIEAFDGDLSTIDFTSMTGDEWRRLARTAQRPFGSRWLDQAKTAGLKSMISFGPLHDDTSYLIHPAARLMMRTDARDTAALAQWDSLARSMARHGTLHPVSIKLAPEEWHALQRRISTSAPYFAGYTHHEVYEAILRNEHKRVARLLDLATKERNGAILPNADGMELDRLRRRYERYGQVGKWNEKTRRYDLELDFNIHNVVRKGLERVIYEDLTRDMVRTKWTWMAEKYDSLIATWSKAKLLNPLNIVRFVAQNMIGDYAQLAGRQHQDAIRLSFKTLFNGDLKVLMREAKAPEMTLEGTHLGERLKQIGLGPYPYQLQNSVTRLTFSKPGRDALGDVTKHLPGMKPVKTAAVWAQQLSTGLEWNRRLALYSTQLEVELARRYRDLGLKTVEALNGKRGRAPAIDPKAMELLFQHTPYGVKAQDLTQQVQRLARMSGATHADAASYADRIGRDWAHMQRQASNSAVAEVNKTLFSYEMNSVDQLVRRVIPFHFWASRALPFYAELALRNPYLVAAYIKATENMEKQRAAGETPHFMRNMIQFFMSPAGYASFMNPLSAIGMIGLFAEAGASEGIDDETFVGSLTRMLGDYGGMNLYPWFASALNMGGALGDTTRGIDPTGFARERRFIGTMVQWGANEGWFGDEHRLLGKPFDHMLQRGRELLTAAMPGVDTIEAPAESTASTTLVLEDLIANLIRERDGLDRTAPLSVDQLEEVMWAMEGGDGNPLFEAAMDQYAHAGVSYALTNSFLPGYTYGQVAGSSQNRLAAQQARDGMSVPHGMHPLAEDPYADGTITPAEQAWMDQWRRETGKTYVEGDVLARSERVKLQQEVRFASPEKQALVLDHAEYQALGDAGDRQVWDNAQKIRTGTTTKGVIVRGVTYTPAQIQAMDGAARRELSNAYAYDGSTNEQAMDRISAARDTYLAARPELAAYITWRDSVYDYPSLEAYRYAVSERNPNAARYFQSRRQEAVQRHRGTPSKVRESLDRDTVSMDAYLAIQGTPSARFGPAPKPTSREGTGVSDPAGELAAMGGAAGSVAPATGAQIDAANAHLSQLMGPVDLRLLPDEIRYVLIQQLPPELQAGLIEGLNAPFNYESNR